MISRVMSVSPTDMTRARLPVWRSVAEAYVLTYRNLGYLLRISWAWVALMFPIGVAIHFALAKPASPESPVFGWDTFLAPLLFWPMLASIAVAWHRKLLADEAWPKVYYLRFDTTAARYLALMLLTSFVLFVPVYVVIVWMERVAVASQASMGAILAMTATMAITIVLGLYIGTRLWLALPARALERSQAPLAEAWRASRGSTWRVLAGSFLCTAPMWAVVVPQILWDINAPPTTRPIAYGIYETLHEILITFLAGMPVESFLSIAYRQLIGGQDATA